MHNNSALICRFLSLGPTNSVFTILGLQCTDSWYVAHSEDLLYRPGYEVFRQCFEDGLLARASGDTIALSPALIIEREHIDAIIERLADAIRKTA